MSVNLAYGERVFRQDKDSPPCIPDTAVSFSRPRRVSRKPIAGVSSEVEMQYGTRLATPSTRSVILLSDSLHLYLVEAGRLLPNAACFNNCLPLSRGPQSLASGNFSGRCQGTLLRLVVRIMSIAAMQRLFVLRAWAFSVFMGGVTPAYTRALHSLLVPCGRV